MLALLLHAYLCCRNHVATLGHAIPTASLCRILRSLYCATTTALPLPREVKKVGIVGIELSEEMVIISMSSCTREEGVKWWCWTWLLWGVGRCRAMVRWTRSKSSGIKEGQCSTGTCGWASTARAVKQELGLHMQHNVWRGDGLRWYNWVYILEVRVYFGSTEIRIRTWHIYGAKYAI